jgi:putative transposase
VKAHQAVFRIATMCRVLGVSTSGYYAWIKRQPCRRARENEKLGERIKQIHRWSRGSYGVPRVHAELRAQGWRVNRKRVAKLMQENKLAGVSRRKSARTTIRSEHQRPAPDLIDRDFSASGPDRLWVADITYVPTWAGFLYLAVVLDAFSRRVVGWSMAGHLRTEFVLDALNMALRQRKPREVVHHSDQGCQYTSIAFGKRCREAGVRPSMGSVGDCFDNALCESFFATLECELLDRRSFRSHTEARRELFEFIEGWYNTHRRHSSLGHLSPLEYERLFTSSPKNESLKLSTIRG